MQIEHCHHCDGVCDCQTIAQEKVCNSVFTGLVTACGNGFCAVNLKSVTLILDVAYERDE